MYWYNTWSRSESDGTRKTNRIYFILTDFCATEHMKIMISVHQYFLCVRIVPVNLHLDDRVSTRQSRQQPFALSPPRTMRANTCWKNIDARNSRHFLLIYYSERLYMFVLCNAYTLHDLLYTSTHACVQIWIRRGARRHRVILPIICLLCRDLTTCVCVCVSHAKMTTTGGSNKNALNARWVGIRVYRRRAITAVISRNSNRW